MPFASVNGATVSYDIAGEGAPVVFLHGFSLDARMWDEQSEPFARHYRVLRYDLRGFGRSSVPAGPYAHTDDLDALMQHVGIEAAHIIGLSMGGGVAVDFALAYPRRVRSLITVDAAIGGFPFTADWGDPGRIARAQGVEAGKAAWLNSVIFEATRACPQPWARVQQMVADYSGFHWLNRSTERRPDQEAFAQLERITAPTLALVGERDLPDFHAIAEAIAQRVPNARKVRLPDLGHMVNMEGPVMFNQVVLDFVQRIA
jgi:pimeloyl-ACP methyl ester carboxylesterase